MPHADVTPRPESSSGRDVIRHVLLRKAHLVVSFVVLSVGDARRSPGNLRHSGTRKALIAAHRERLRLPGGTTWLLLFH